MQLVKARTPPGLTEILEKHKRERLRRMVDWEEEDCSAYKN
jgi:hypothetical protein